MPVICRLRVAFQQENADPKNQVVINPVFRSSAVTFDGNSLCSDLAVALNSWMVTGSNGGQMVVKSYDVEGTKPVFPNGTSTKFPGVYKQPMGDPTQAVCLSFYNTVNQPRRRGRLFIPAWWATTSAAVLANRIVDPSLMTKIAALPPIFAALGGADVDWVVWSPTDHAARIVTNWFINDRWDHVRSRGLKETARQTGTTSG